MNGIIAEALTHVKRIRGRPVRFPARTFSVRLPGTPRETCFRVTIQTIWPVGRDVDVRLQALVERGLLKAAQTAASDYSVLDPDEARIAINLELCRNLYLAEENFRLDAASVTDIWVDPADRRMAETQDELRRETALVRAQQQQKLEELLILADQVLSDPGLVGLWWLDGKPDKLEQLVKLGKANVFTEAAALFRVSVEQPTIDPIPDLIRTFVNDLSSDLRDQLIRQLRLVFTSYERDDLAAQLHSYQETSAGIPGQGPSDSDGHIPSWGA